MFNQDKNNIFSITRGDSGFISCIYNKEGVENPTVVYDTRNSTASAEDIKLGKIAYNENGKVVGTYEVSLMDKTIYENGTYKASLDGVEGYGTVVADVISPIAGKVVSGTAVNLTAKDLYGATEIKTYKFFQDTTLQSIVFPNTITDIGQAAFSGCTALTYVGLPTGLTTIGPSAFNGCSSLEDIVFPNTVTDIGQSAFSRSNIINLTISGNNTTIGSYCFQVCPKLVSVVLRGVSVISPYSFQGDYYRSVLKTIDVGEEVTSIGRDTFENNRSVTHIIIRATTPPTLENSNAFMDTGNGPIYVPDNSVNTYKTETNWATSWLAARIHPLSEIEGA